ncbi:MAG TPA: SDR family oxidoreductase [Anaerolineales bacterium]|nr:SDR family oxidoreductase [Anaerolineales bacterium]
MLLKGRTAIVYGASGAVGKAVASAFAREGATVVLSARRREPLMEAAAEISGKGGLTDVRTVDATDPDAIQQHLSEVVQRHGPVSLMFNAVSWDDFQGQPFTEMPFDLFFAPVRLGLTSWFHTGTALAKHMAQHGGGTILGITANAGRQPFGGVGGFGVACAAVEHYLRQVAVENGPARVRVCWVRSPGSPDAPGVRDAWQAYGEQKGLTFEEVHREFARDVPLRQITPLAQIANAAVLLASDLAAGMTATMANATGGAQVD